MSSPENEASETKTPADRSLSVQTNNESATLAVLRNVFGEQAGRAISNFDGDAKNRWRMTAIATGPLALKFDDLPADRVINIKYFYAHRITLEGSDGELNDCIRTVLFDENGTAYAFVSDILARDLAMIVQTFGVRPYDPPLAVKVVRSDGKSGHKFYSLVPA